MVFEEALIVERRKNYDKASEATLLQLAVSGVLSKKANDEFMKAVKRLIED